MNKASKQDKITQTKKEKAGVNVILKPAAIRLSLTVVMTSLPLVFVLIN